MCDEAYRRTQIGQLRDDWHDLRIPLRFPESIPNFAPLDGFRTTDRVEILRPAADALHEAEMVTRRWSWPGPGGRTVTNVRSDGRRIVHASRCRITVDGFFECTNPHGERPRRAPASKWPFPLRDQPWCCIAGI